MTRTDPTRIPELMSRDRGLLDALLDATVLAHVAFVTADGTPGVLPTAAIRWGDELLVHGSTGSRWMRLAAGAPAVVSIAVVDGVTVARSAFESSLLYRSAVLFGSFRRLEAQEKARALAAVTDRLIPGRVAEVRGSTPRELAATMVLAMPIREWSLRVSDDWAEDPEHDVAGDAWAGQVRFGDRPATVLGAPDLRAGIPVPLSVQDLRARH
ncbi:pyridoxamine 5'-phosphate oxidase family protein [Flexivirga caeni]|uniref:Pyridoxamine 5'-phosphate oxidase family protein n=1 Tax=Flexivirga caeni TaxID=2294115 RepID=A0A3M9MEH9_9MICO|nr:pyridoxamine 5'-phosphate oxidase family protein [Flexivirga caeni]RNI23959.1 pyridoxamine 5'-phosphate oxidase family protein [Flexivirga caeni]